MKKLILAGAAVAMISLAGCGTVGGPAVSPVSTAGTTVDEKALYSIENGYRTLLTGVSHAVDAGLIVPGSPTALAVDAALDRLRQAITNAEKAQRAASGADLAAQIAKARREIEALGRLIPGLPTIPGL